MHKRAYLAAATLALVASSASAQQLRVIVRDSTSGAPVSGAVVQLLSTQDSAVARSVTGLGGAAAIDIDSGMADLRRLRVVKIGFRPASRVLASLDHVVDIQLVRLPVHLVPVRVIAAAKCPYDDDARRAAALWEETRPNLIAVLATREEHPVNIILLRYTRDGTSTLEWVRQIVNASSASQSFATARAQLELFLADVAPGGYALPDEDVLLNGAFVNTHCFRTRRGAREHLRDLAIEFEPPPGADAPVDVKGRLWIDEARRAPRAIEFQYTNPVVAMRDTAGGAATIETVGDGVAVVTRWWLGVPPRGLDAAPVRSPAMALQGRGARPAVFAVRPTIKESRRFPTDIITEVAEIALASWDTTTTWIGTISHVSGTVVSKDTHLPLANVPVTLTTLVDPPYTIATDSAGRFELRNVFERPYMLKAADTTLTGYLPENFAGETKFSGVQAPRSMISLAPPGDATPIQVDRGVDPVVTIEVPSVERALHDACGRAARGDSSGIIAGRVLTTWDVPERSEPATISARWTAGGRQILQETRADALGFFRVCGVPRGRGVSLTAVQGRASSGETLVVTSDRWLLTPVQLHLSPPPARSSPLLPAPTAERWGRILPGEFGSRP